MAKFYKILNAIIIILTLLDMIYSTSMMVKLQHKRQTDDYEEEMPAILKVETDGKVLTGPPICPQSTPCGWANYKPFVRTVNYYFRNTCICPSKKLCLKSDDDLSNNAYVYRCRTPSHYVEVTNQNSGSTASSSSSSSGQSSATTTTNSPIS